MLKWIKPYLHIPIYKQPEDLSPDTHLQVTPFYKQPLGLWARRNSAARWSRVSDFRKTRFFSLQKKCQGRGMNLDFPGQRRVVYALSKDLSLGKSGGGVRMHPRHRSLHHSIFPNSGLVLRPQREDHPTTQQFGKCLLFAPPNWKNRLTGWKRLLM